MQATTAPGFFCCIAYPAAAINVWIDQASSSCRSMPLSYVFDLGPSLLQQPVALRSRDPPRLSRISKTSSIGLSAQDHSGDEFNPVRYLLCGGSCHGQSGSVFSR